MIRRAFANTRKHFLPVFLLLFLSERACGQGTEEQLERIAVDWAKRQEIAGRVRYRVSGEVLKPRENMTDSLYDRPIKLEGVPETIKLPFQWTLLLDLQTNRYRLEEERHLFQVDERKIVRNAWVNTFDGKALWGQFLHDPNLVRKPTDVDIGITSGNLLRFRIEPDKFPAFYGHGIVPYAGSGHLSPGNFTIVPDTDVLTVHGRVVHDGQQCLVLRTPPSEGTSTCFDELWVDLSRESALVRHARYAGKTPITDLVIWHRHTPHGWLPDHWEQTLRGSGAKVREIWRAHVDGLEFEPAVTDADFRIKEKPCMLVRTGVNPPDDDPNMAAREPTNIRHYRIDENGNRREVVFENGVEKRAARMRWLWRGGGIILVVAIFGCLFWALRRRARVRTVRVRDSAAETIVSPRPVD